MYDDELIDGALSRYALENGFDYVKREGENLTLNGEILEWNDGLCVVEISDKAVFRRPKGWFEFLYCYVCPKNDSGYLTLAVKHGIEFGDPSYNQILAKKIVEEK